MPEHRSKAPKRVRTDKDRETDRKRYAADPEKVRESKRANYVKNRDKINERNRKYRAENPEKVKATLAKYKNSNLEKVAAFNRNYINARVKIDPEFKMLRDLRARLRKAISKDQKSGKMVDLLGCTVSELRIHIEQQWLPGMTWENRCFRGWHLDHVKPLSSFDLTDPQQLASACHYSNLQPLWWRDNLVKGNSHV